MAPPDHGLELERFDYARVGEQWAVLRVLARLATDSGAPAHAHLVVRPEQRFSQLFPARACRSERRLLPGGDSELLWRVLFAVPFEVIESSSSVFELTAPGHPALALPVPCARIAAPGALSLDHATADVGRLAVGQFCNRAVALATAVAVTSSTPAVALADAGLTTVHHAQVSEQRIEHLAHVAVDRARAETALRNRQRRSSWGTRPASPKAGHSSRTRHSSSRPSASPRSATRGAAGSSTGNGSGVAHPSVTHVFSAPAQVAPATSPAPAAAATPASTPAPVCPPPSSTSTTGGVAVPTSGVPAPAQPVSCTSPGVSTPTSPSPTPSSPSSTPSPAPGAPPVTGGHRERASHRPAPAGTPGAQSGGSSVAPLGGLSHRPPVKLPASSTSTGGSAPTLVSSPPGFLGPKSWTGTVTTNSALSGALGNLSDLLSNGDSPPAFLIPVYMEAGRRYHVPWEVLAAINAVESDYGRNLSTSSAGAIGWMQFEPSTWHQYGVAADGHSVPNPYDPRDAIFSAARYLAAAGAAQDISRAVFAYNHAPWYVEMVLARARAIAAGVRPQRQTVSKRGVVSVFFATDVRKHPTVRFKGGLLTHYDRLIASANMVSAANFPYLYGGGHEQPARFGPFDCSGSVSYVVQQAGYKVPTTVSGEIPIWKFPAGPGRVTIFYNPVHTFMRIGNRYFGTSGFARPGGGAGWFDANKLPADYLATFHEVHIPRLGVDSFAPPRHLKHAAF